MPKFKFKTNFFFYPGKARQPSAWGEKNKMADQLFCADRFGGQRTHHSSYRLLMNRGIPVMVTLITIVVPCCSFLNVLVASSSGF